MKKGHAKFLWNHNLLKVYHYNLLEKTFYRSYKIKHYLSQMHGDFYIDIAFFTSMTQSVSIRYLSKLSGTSSLRRRTVPRRK